MPCEQTYTFDRIDREPPRIILYLGKGGVGKTTTAAATAVRSAELGHKTLVTSTDVAHSLGDALDTPLGNEPVEVADRLWAQEISAVADVDATWGRTQKSLARVLRARGVDAVAAEELSIVPGMDEIVSLIHIRRSATEADFDRVIVDAAPTGESIRLLTVPDAFRWYASHLGPSTSAMAAALRPLADRVARGPGELLDLVDRLDAAAAELKAILTDPVRSSYRVVVQPEKMIIREAERAMSYLALFGYPVDAIVVNRILPDDTGANPFLDELRQLQAGYLADIDVDFAPLPQFRTPHYPSDVAGLPALTRFADDCFGPADPGDVFYTGAPQRLREDDDGSIVLELPLPFAEAESLDIRKRGDEMYIRIGSFKREMILPHALAGSEPTGASLREHVLTIRFEAVRDRSVHPGEGVDPSPIGRLR